MAFIAENLAPIMFAALIIVLLLGYPVAFALAFVGFFFGFIGIELGLLPATLFKPFPIAYSVRCRTKHCWPYLSSPSWG